MLNMVDQIKNLISILLLKYLVVKSYLINLATSSKEAILGLTNIVGYDGIVSKSILFRFIIIKVLVSLKSMIIFLIKYVDKKYDLIEVDKGGLKITENTTISEFIENDKNEFSDQKNEVDDKMNSYDKIYLQYSLDSMCIKDLLRKYSNIGNNSIINILKLNNIKYTSDSKITVKSRSNGKTESNSCLLFE